MTSDTRAQVLDCIRTYPGIHLRGIERLLGLSSALVHYHVRELVEAGSIIEEPLHGRTRYFDARPVPSERLSGKQREAVGLLREEAPMNIVLLLLDEGPLSHRALVDETRLAKSTVTYNVDKLVEAHLVDRVDEGSSSTLRLRDEKTLRRLLMGHAPTPDVLRKFRRLWEDFYAR